MGAYLVHHGIKGMKWGVRRYQNSDGSLTLEGEKRYGIKNKKSYTVKTANGDPLTFQANQNFNGFLARKSKKYRDAVNRYYDYNLLDSKGTNVGNLQLELQDGGKTTYVNWLSTNSKGSGKGYGRAGMLFVEQFAKEHGSKKITAEVVGHTPQINHLVDSLGYIRLEQLSTSKDDFVWGGLTSVEKKLGD